MIRTNISVLFEHVTSLSLPRYHTQGKFKSFQRFRSDLNSYIISISFIFLTSVSMYCDAIRYILNNWFMLCILYLYHVLLIILLNWWWHISMPKHVFKNSCPFYSIFIFIATILQSCGFDFHVWNLFSFVDWLNFCSRSLPEVLKFVLGMVKYLNT